MRTPILALLVAATAAHAQPAPRAAIEQVLQTSAADWSRGDLAAFMRCYEASPETTYVGRRGMVTGYAAIRDRYAAAYPAGAGHGMGRLSLAITQFRPLDAAYVLVTGRFALARKTDGGDVDGTFTLLMHLTSVGWRISYDHSS